MNAFAQSIEPHTAYLSPRTSANFEISMKLSLEGIGALLGRENEYTTISRVVAGGPAAKSEIIELPLKNSDGLSENEVTKIGVFCLISVFPRLERRFSQLNSETPEHDQIN